MLEAVTMILTVAAKKMTTILRHKFQANVCIFDTCKRIDYCETPTSIQNVENKNFEKKMSPLQSTASAANFCHLIYHKARNRKAEQTIEWDKGSFFGFRMILFTLLNIRFWLFCFYILEDCESYFWKMERKKSMICSLYGEKYIRIDNKKKVFLR